MTDLPTPDFVMTQTRNLVGLVGDFTMQTRGEIPGLYEAFFGLRDDIPDQMPGGLFGVSMNAQPDGSFRYGVGVEVSSVGELPGDTCQIILSEGEYAVFRLCTPMAELPAMFDAVFSDWLPGSDKSQREGAVFEYYLPEPPGENGAMRYEIWVPVADAA